VGPAQLKRYVELLRESLSTEDGMSVNIALVVDAQAGNGNGHH